MERDRVRDHRAERDHLTVDASAVIDGMTCVSGPVSLTLPGGARCRVPSRGHRPE